VIVTTADSTVRVMPVLRVVLRKGKSTRAQSENSLFAWIRLHTHC